MALFQCNSQEWFNTDSIEHICDLGWDISVVLKSGKVCRVNGSDREAFEKAIAPMVISDEKPHDETVTFRWYQGPIYWGSACQT